MRARSNKGADPIGKLGLRGEGGARAERAGTDRHDELPPAVLSDWALHLVLVQRAKVLVVVFGGKESGKGGVEVGHEDVVDAEAREGRRLVSSTIWDQSSAKGAKEAMGSRRELQPVGRHSRDQLLVGLDG